MRKSLFFLIWWKRQHTLTVERTEPGRWCIDFHQRPGDMWLINRVQSLRIVPWLRVRNIEKFDDSPAISTNVVIGVPVFIVSFIVRLLVGVLIERVFDAFVENLFGVV